MSAVNTGRYLAIKVMMMPRDTNPYGTIFGGVLLSYIDQAGAAGARFEMARAGWRESSIVTVAVDGVEFLQPVFVGDLVSFWTELERVGRTSITMRVTVETDRRGETVRVTEAQIKYVAIKTEGGHRIPIPIRD
jgi:acyl-CoA thioesterase YciA